jgi:transcriptional regulator with XRE-family HTH domain
MNSRLVEDWMYRDRWSRKRLAEELGVTPSTIWRYLTGKSEPSLTTYKVLAQMMGEPVEKLMFQKELKKTG